MGYSIGIVVGKRFLIGSGSRFNVEWAKVTAGDIVACCSLVRTVCGVGNRSICITSRSGMVSMFFVLVASSGISWRRIIRRRCRVVVLGTVGLSCIRRCIIVVRSSCCVTVRGSILVVRTNCGIIASRGVSC